MLVLVLVFVLAALVLDFELDLCPATFSPAVLSSPAPRFAASTFILVSTLASVLVNIDVNRAPSRHPRTSSPEDKTGLLDIKHALCEVDKHSRKRHPDIQLDGTRAPKSIKHPFDADHHALLPSISTMTPVSSSSSSSPTPVPCCSRLHS
ncbi:hypothetical protein FRC06_011848 [Ceratobasidium sp. 370]|nr:hypothetical protein FRC06_011848 [Ceratobasidium sp. 370]